MKIVPISPLLEKSHAGIVQNMGDLNRALTALRFEGKTSFGKNLRRSRSALSAVLTGLAEEMKFEEDILFPYLGSHLPKLQFMTDLLTMEHEDLRRSLDALSGLFDKLNRQKSVAGWIETVEEMRKRAGYLNYFLHNHTWAENQAVYKVLDKELKTEEKKAICAQLKRRQS